jgi:hypothetical protein
MDLAAIKGELTTIRKFEESDKQGRETTRINELKTCLTENA